MSSRVPDENPRVHRADKATLFVQGEFGFGFRKFEVRWIEWEERPYAQYAHAIHVRFVPRGARRPRGFVHAGINWPFVVVAGWNVPDLTAEDFDTVREDAQVRVQQSRHRSFSPEWAVEFDAGLRAYLAHGGRILIDGRS
jgi:hypothetical protein